MKSNTTKTAQVQKWGLFCLLTGSLGFSLSMNPDHFNHIVRNEPGFHSVDLAQTAAANQEAFEALGKSEVEAVETVAAEKAAAKKLANEKAAAKKVAAEKAAAKKAAAELAAEQALAEEAAAEEAPAKDVINLRTGTDTAPGESKTKEQTFIITGKNGGLYKAHVTEDGKGSQAKLEALEGSVCVACDATILLNSSIDEIKDLNEELKAFIDRKTRTEKPKTTLAKDKIDGSEIDQDFLKDVAAVCKKKIKEDRLSCHTEKLVTMSNKLDDSDESEKLVKRYFETNILPSLRDSFSSRTTDPMTLAVDQSRLTEADEMARMLIEELNPDNSEAVISRLTKLKAGSYTAQLNYAREMYLTAQQDKASKDMFTMTRGFNMERLALTSLNPTLVNSNLMLDTQNWRASMMQGNKDEYLNVLQTDFGTPVRGIVGQLGNINFYSSNPQEISTQLAQLSLPDLSGMNMTPISIGLHNSYTPGYNTPGQTSYTPGMPGNIPAAVYAGRMNTQGRGANFPLLPMTQQFQSVGLSQTPSPLQMNPNVYNPALLNSRSSNRY